MRIESSRSPIRSRRASPTVACLALSSFSALAALPQVVWADQPPPVLLVAPPAKAPPVLLVAPPAKAPPVLPVAPPPTAPPVLPVAPPPSVPPVLPVAPPHEPYGSRYPAPAPYLLPPPVWVPPPPAALSYVPTSPQPTQRRPRYGLVAAGVSVLGGLWTVSVVAGVTSGHSELAIPLIGPIFTIVDLDRRERPSDARTFVSGLLTLDALFQTAGLVMAIVGGASRTEVRRRPAAPRVYPYGAGIYGRF